MEADILAARALHEQLNTGLAREERRRRARGEATGQRATTGVTPRSVREEGQLCPSIVLLHLL
jgi:hypothetical protein